MTEGRDERHPAQREFDILLVQALRYLDEYGSVIPPELLPELTEEQRLSLASLNTDAIMQRLKERTCLH